MDVMSRAAAAIFRFEVIFLMTATVCLLTDRQIVKIAKVEEPKLLISVESSPLSGLSLRTVSDIKGKIHTNLTSLFLKVLLLVDEHNA